MALASKNRLNEDRDIKFTQRKGMKDVSRGFIFLFLKSKSDESRFAFVASKKVGNSVERNRAKRILKEIIYNKLPDFKTNIDVVLIARTEILNMPKEEVELDIDKTLKRLELI